METYLCNCQMLTNGVDNHFAKQEVHPRLQLVSIYQNLGFMQHAVIDNSISSFGCHIHLKLTVEYKLNEL
jgi:hypothetical protein